MRTTVDIRERGDGINERQKMASGSSALSTDVVLVIFILTTPSIVKLMHVRHVIAW